MSVKDQIKDYIKSLPEGKQEEIQTLHQQIIKLNPKNKLWFFDGTDDNGKQVTNPNIGYGGYTIAYKDGSSREFYRVGISGNKSGLSVYILGLKDKQHLKNNYATKIGKAKVTGYCINFKSLVDINLKVLEAAIMDGFNEK